MKDPDLIVAQVVELRMNSDEKKFSDKGDMIILTWII